MSDGIRSQSSTDVSNPATTECDAESHSAFGGTTTQTWPLKMALTQIAEQQTLVYQQQLVSNCQPSDAYAYVSASWGDEVEHLCLGMALGSSITASGTTLPCYLLHTDDVPRDYLSILQQWWILRSVPYIICNPDLNKHPRFVKVFTKIHIFDSMLLPFKKVLWLDLDTLVIRNIDHVFEVDAPAAAPNVGCADIYDHGSVMSENTTINAGVVLVTP